jgi:uncharacterized protein YbjT (DUF2867 family)
VPASPSSGVDTLTGAGLAEALAGADVVVDVTNSPSFEDNAVMKFFETSTRNLLSAEKAAGVKHHVALSVIGADRVPDSGYMRAKVAQENLIKAATTPYTILRATQFFEFMGRIADESTEGNTVRLPPILMRPIAAEDVADALSRVTVGKPVQGYVELGGPELFRLDELVRLLLKAKHDPRQVTTDVNAAYYGAVVNDQSLIPSDKPMIGPTRYEEWLDTTLEKGKVA